MVGGRTSWLILPPLAWLALFLVAPLVIIVVVSFFMPTLSGFEVAFTLENYQAIFQSRTYLETIGVTFLNALVTVVLSLVLGYPIAYFLTFYVRSLAVKIALFIIALAPFWVSFLIRVIAWIPMLGREGLLNMILLKLGIVAEPLEILLFSNFAVLVAMLQLYILFMIAPIFYVLSSIDRDLFEAARDLGASPFQVFRDVVWPLSVPGVVIGVVFVFVLTMGDFATVRLIGGGNVSSIGLLIQNLVNYIQFPSAAAVACILVLSLIAGIWLLLRTRNIVDAL